jgi:hypothetical protein
MSGAGMGDEFAAKVIDRLARIETKQDTVVAVLLTLATKTELGAIEERLQALERDRTWIVRAVVSAWIAGLGVIGAMFTGVSKKFGGG